MQDRVSARVSSLGGERFEPVGNIEVTTSATKPDLEIDTQRTYQTIEGFGGSFNEAGWVNLACLSEDVRDRIMRRLFDRESGAHFTLCRTPIGASDYALEPYSYAEEPGDTELKSFTIERDHKYLIPYIKAAKKINPALKLLASPWSPPAWMKTNNDRENGGNLKLEYYESYANYFVKYLQAYEAEGLRVDYVTIQNESEVEQTFDSCLWTTRDSADFIKNFLGPAFQKHGITARILMYDHNRDHPHYPIAVLDDPEAKKYIYGTAIHGYACKEFDNVKKIHDAHPDKAIMFTEYSHPHVPNYSFKDGENVAWQVINDINNWCTSWIYWNMVLNQTGGPNHDTWNQDALVIVNTETKDVAFEGEYYYMRHFSNFVEPGAKRLHIEGTEEKIHTAAFANPDGSLALVVLNMGEEDWKFSAGTDGKIFDMEVPAHGIVSCLF